MDINEILNDAGYSTTISGYKAVLRAIADMSDKKDRKLCSGYRVFPDGTKCDGCQDCQEI